MLGQWLLMLKIKTMTNYQEAKQQLKEIAKQVKKSHPTDKPLIRMVLNDSADSLSREYNLSEYQLNLLAKYTCTLHPKD